MSYPPPQYPQAPAYPQAPGYPPQAPQYPAQYPAASVPYPQPAPPAAAPAAQGSLDDYFSQPSFGGGPAWTFKDKPIGTSYSGIVARKVTNADVRQQTDPSGRPLAYRDGRPKFVMVVPMIMQVSPEFQEGIATWWVKGQARDELVRAMTEAGTSDPVPESGAGITVTLTGRPPVPGLNPQHQYQITYIRPQAQVPAQSSPAPAAPPAPAAAGLQVPDGLTPDQAALMARLTGGQAA